MTHVLLLKIPKEELQNLLLTSLEASCLLVGSAFCCLTLLPLSTDETKVCQDRLVPHLNPAHCPHFWASFCHSLPPMQPPRGKVHLLFRSRILFTVPIPGTGRGVGAWHVPPALLICQGYQGCPGVRTVLLQLARNPTSQWVGFRKMGERHIEARPEGVHHGAGLGHHRLSQPGGPGARSWVEIED